MLETETLQVDGIQDNGDLDIVDHLSRMSIGIASVEKQNFNNSNPIFKDSWISSKVYINKIFNNLHHSNIFKIYLNYQITFKSF